MGLPIKNLTRQKKKKKTPNTNSTQKHYQKEKKASSLHTEGEHTTHRTQQKSGWGATKTRGGRCRRKILSIQTAGSGTRSHKAHTQTKTPNANSKSKLTGGIQRTKESLPKVQRARRVLWFSSSKRI